MGVEPALHQRTRHYYSSEYTPILTSELSAFLQPSSISLLGQYSRVTFCAGCGSLFYLWLELISYLPGLFPTTTRNSSEMPVIHPLYSRVLVFPVVLSLVMKFILMFCLWLSNVPFADADPYGNSGYNWYVYTDNLYVFPIYATILYV